VVNDGEASTYLYSDCSLHISEWSNLDFGDAAHTTACTNKRGESCLNTDRLIFARVLYKCDHIEDNHC
jgi:hypothetical protein